jgi:hypothetical protein
MQEGIKLEEDPETGPNNVDAGDRWRALLAWLFQAACEKGRIPTRLGDHSPHPQRRQEGGDWMVYGMAVGMVMVDKVVKQRSNVEHT